MKASSIDRRRSTGGEEPGACPASSRHSNGQPSTAPIKAAIRMTFSLRSTWVTTSRAKGASRMESGSITKPAKGARINATAAPPNWFRTIFTDSRAVQDVQAASAAAIPKGNRIGIIGEHERYRRDEVGGEDTPQAEARFGRRSSRIRRSAYRAAKYQAGIRDARHRRRPGAQPPDRRTRACRTGHSDPRRG